ncbi:MAG: phosphoribosylanthranilate isomerase [Bacillota bacterium]
MTLVKICGITNLDTALAAAAAGADALGFVFASGRRRVAPETARDIIRRLPPEVLTVGVFVDEDPETVRGIAAYCGLGALQFHGRESPDYCRDFQVRVVKAFGVTRSSAGDLERDSAAYPVWALLLDTAAGGRPGGTGRVFDWRLVESLKFSRPVILAGGLNPENVQAAITAVRPYGVDVSTGVETGGVKDPEKIRRFITLAREAG